MSIPDAVIFCQGADMPPRFPGWPHRLALLPAGIGVADLGEAGCRQAGIFLIDPDCAHVMLNDSAFGVYLAARLPLLLYTQRACDLRPILRRGGAFRARGYTAEVLAP